MSNEKKRSIMQVRPKSGDKRYYAPNRDLAYIYAPAMREAISALDAVNWTDETRELIEAMGVTEEDIGMAVQAITTAHRYFVNFPDIAEPDDALRRTNFYECHPGARYLVFGRLGAVLFGGFFVALRDVSPQADVTGQDREIAEFIAAGATVMHNISGMASPTPDTESELRSSLLEERERRSTAETALEQCRKREEALQRENAQMGVTVGTKQAEIDSYQGLGFWATIRLAFSKLRAS